MSVLLKEDVYRTVDWKPVRHGDLNAAFLIGREGQRIDNETAKKLGLVNGEIVEKEDRPGLNKEHSYREDKSGRRHPKPGKPLSAPDPDGDEEANKDQSREDRIKSIMRDMAKEAEEGGEEKRDALFTTSGAPDSRVISNRLEESVSAAERDELWAELSEAAE